MSADNFTTIIRAKGGTFALYDVSDSDLAGCQSRGMAHHEICQHIAKNYTAIHVGTKDECLYKERWYSCRNTVEYGFIDLSRPVYEVCQD
jgi:hypothetical protein